VKEYGLPFSTTYTTGNKRRLPAQPFVESGEGEVVRELEGGLRFWRMVAAFEMLDMRVIQSTQTFEGATQPGSPSSWTEGKVHIGQGHYICKSLIPDVGSLLPHSSHFRGPGELDIQKRQDNAIYLHITDGLCPFSIFAYFVPAQCRLPALGCGAHYFLN
jgi:hypothetical protein